MSIALIGRVEVYNGEKHIRTEFVPSHSRHGEIMYYSEYGDHERTEFENGHARYGETDIYDRGVFVQTIKHSLHNASASLNNSTQTRTISMPKHGLPPPAISQMLNGFEDVGTCLTDTSLRSSEDSSISSCSDTLFSSTTAHGVDVNRTSSQRAGTKYVSKTGSTKSNYAKNSTQKVSSVKSTTHKCTSTRLAHPKMYLPRVHASTSESPTSSKFSSIESFRSINGRFANSDRSLARSIPQLRSL